MTLLKFYEEIKIVKFITVKILIVVTKGWGKIKRNYCSMDTEFMFGNDEKVLEIDSSDSFITLSLHFNAAVIYLEMVRFITIQTNK